MLRSGRHLGGLLHRCRHCRTEIPFALRAATRRWRITKAPVSTTLGAACFESRELADSAGQPGAGVPLQTVPGDVGSPGLLGPGSARTRVNCDAILQLKLVSPAGEQYRFDTWG